jgi:tripartite-type tricarboxylate transporter receptor subunit TctC
MYRILKHAYAAAALVLACGCVPAFAAEPAAKAYPARPVKIVIPLGPGNSLEIAVRMVAEKLSAAFRQPFVIEPQPGAAGQIGTEHVARAPADGYTLLAANDGVITMLPNLQRVPYDSIRDFVPITQLVGIPFALIAHPSVPAKDARELVALAKAQPGKLEFSSGGNGSAQQVAMQLFMGLTGTKFTHVPYKGAPQAALDVVSGQIPVAFAGVPIVASFIKQGKLRALGISREQRLALLPDAPTLTEQGIPFRFATWGGLFAPAGTPGEIVARLNQETLKALKSPDLQERMAAFGLEIRGSTPEAFAETVRSDFSSVAKALKDAGLADRTSR